MKYVGLLFVFALMTTVYCGNEGTTPDALGMSRRSHDRSECGYFPRIRQCRRGRRERYIWTYNQFTGECMEIFGCYRFHDNNVFRNRRECRRTCVFGRPIGSPIGASLPNPGY